MFILHHYADPKIGNIYILVYIVNVVSKTY